MVVRACETSPALGEASRGCGDLFYLKAGLVVLHSREFFLPFGKCNSGTGCKQAEQDEGVQGSLTSSVGRRDGAQ